MNKKMQEVSELLKQDLNDGTVMLQLMSHPESELVISGLLRIINEERVIYNEKLNQIIEKICKLEDCEKAVSENLGKAQKVIDSIQAGKPSKQYEIQQIGRLN